MNATGLLLSTDRLRIRPWRVDEADRLFDIHRRLEVARWLGGTPMRDRRQAVERIEQYGSWLARDPRYGAWAVLERDCETPAGSVLLKALPDGQGEIEVGWHLHPDSWGRGLATEAAGALVERAFSEGLQEVWAVTHLDNLRSMAVCGKIGMRMLGVTHRWYHVPCTMFWRGRRAGQEPSLATDEPAPPELGSQAGSRPVNPRRRSRSDR
jgi:RimJ/RimL family protein N-acetyltransferase